jgi:hypothetical protein
MKIIKNIIKTYHRVYAALLILKYKDMDKAKLESFKY